MSSRIFVLIFLCAGPAFAEELQAPKCLRMVGSTASDATIKFEARGGDSFEAERYYGGRWTPYKAAIVTSGQQHSVTVPLSKNLMNIVRVCAIAGSARACSMEGVYAKR